MNTFKITTILALGLLLSAFSFSDIFGKKPYTDINNSEFNQLIEKDNITIIDIRRPDEWRQTGVIKNSKLLTMFDARGQFQQNFVNRIRLLPKDKPIVLICHTGSRSQVGSKFLAKEMGFSKVYNVEGGITGWKRGKNPVVLAKKSQRL